MHQRRTIKNNIDNNLLYISKTEIGDDFKTNYHSHPNVEIILIIKGEGSIISKEKKYSIKEKDLFIINTYMDHYEISKNSCQFMAIGIDKFNAYLKDDFNKKILHFSLKDEDYEKIYSLYNIIYIDSKNDINDDVITNCFLSILSIIKRHINVNFNSVAKSKYSFLVANAIDIIENNYYSNITLNDLSKRLSVAKSTLEHQLKKETGYSIIEFKINCQLEEACNLLKITNMQISDIAMEAGFNNVSYFSKIFKKKYQLTPKIYRELYKRTTNEHV